MIAIQQPVSPSGQEFEEVVELDLLGAIQLFKRTPVCFTRGSGSRIWDSEGKEYLDFLMGIAVCGLGHCHPGVVRAIQDQAATLAHTSNLFYIANQARLAERLHNLSGGYLSYFANSGSEANECAIKLVRKWGNSQRPARVEIITALNSFHGRTMATISATGQEKVKKGFGPLLPGFSHVPFNDIDALAAAVTPKTAGIMLELIQAESNNAMPEPGYLQAVRRLCDERKLLLIFDEVQTGIARSGTLFAWQSYDVRPDIFTLAKALGNGFPISACLARREAASAFQPGDHGGTYGGNHVACAAALAVLDAIEKEGVLENVQRCGRQLKLALDRIASSEAGIKEVRGLGLILALELERPLAREVVTDALERGLVINATSETVIRLRPALNVTPSDIDEAAAILQASLHSVLSRS